MRVTVVIPNYNYGHWIADAIMSIENQSYPADKLQLVVIDDNSRDNSEKVIRDTFDKCNIRCSLLTQDPTKKGPSAARNAAIKFVWHDTDIFAMLDADDMYLPNNIETKVQVMSRDYNNIGVVYNDPQNLNIDDDSLTEEFLEPYSQDSLLQRCIVNSQALVNKKALELCGLYDEEMRTCEDYDLWIRISQKFVLVHIPEVLHTARIHSDNSTNSVPKEIWQQNWQRIALKYSNENQQIRTHQPS